VTLVWDLTEGIVVRHYEKLRVERRGLRVERID
jgi:hypothetical protein